MEKYTFVDNGRIKIEDIDGKDMMFRNFRGEPGPKNRQGDRNFTIVLHDEEMAQQLANRHWYVKAVPPRREGDELTFRIDVKLGYKIDRLKPKIVIHSKQGAVSIDEDMVYKLDGYRFERYHVVLNPHYWINDNGEDQIKAYLLEFHGDLVEDYFADKYAEEEYPAD